MKIICKMKHLELEKELTAKIRKRRLLEGGVTVFLFVYLIIKEIILFMVIYVYQIYMYQKTMNL